MRMTRKVSCACAIGLFGLVAACSDPVAPASQAAVSIYLTTSVNAMAGVSCPASPHWVNVPFAKGGGQQVFAHTKNATAIDNQDQMSVSCTVKDNGGPFEVNATLKSPATDPVTGMPVNPTNVTLQTTITAGQSATGTVTVLDNTTATTYSSADAMSGAAAPTCMFSVVPPATASDPPNVAAGRIWASVNCPSFRDPGSSNLKETCSITNGYIVLENCGQ